MLSTIFWFADLTTRKCSRENCTCFSETVLAERRTVAMRREAERTQKRNAIPHRRAETKSTLIRYKRFPTCLTPSLIVIAPLLTERARVAAGVSRAARRLSLSVIAARYQRSSSLAPGCGDRGCRFHRRKTKARYRALSPRSEEQPSSSEYNPAKSRSRYVYKCNNVS